MAPRLVRRRPLAERVKAYLDPLDFLLWLSEHLESSDWSEWLKEWVVPTGVVLNVVFLVARANTGPTLRSPGNGVFGDDDDYTPWSAWFATFIVHFLSIISFMNAAHTFLRRRHYRLFESSVDAPPSTPSAHRVRVDSSPVSSSPLRFLSKMIAFNAAEARSHPDVNRDVWELAVWDPTSWSLQMFCLFSPGHILVYWLFLPTTPLDLRPSTTVLTTIVLAGLLSTQLLMIQSAFSQQSKDTSVIHREVLNEYDTKYVHPRTQPLMRDVGTQYSSESGPGEINSHETYTPTIILKRGFHTRPNPNYAKHVDPEASLLRESPLRDMSTNTAPPIQTPVHLRDVSSPLRPPSTNFRQPQFRPYAGQGQGNGGSLGIYSHTQSPLRKSASTTFPDSQRQGEKFASPIKRDGRLSRRNNVVGSSTGAFIDNTHRR